MEHTKAYQEFKKNGNTKFVRYSEGAEMYHMGVSKFMQMAKDAKAIYKLGQLVLVNLKIFDEYLETFHIVDDEFYKQVKRMVTQLQPDVRAYLHGGEVIKRYIKVEEMAYEYGFSVEETEYIAKAASSLYKLTRIHLVKKERFDEFMKHIYKVPGTNKQIIKKFARIGEASIIYSIGRHRFIELARAAGATYKINEGTGGTVLVNLEIFDNYMEQFRQPVRPLKEPLYGQEEGELNE